MEQREALRLALVERAKEARKNSYCPYSGFAVGAALLCADGSVYAGCNIENAGFTATCCAERTAFFRAVNDGKRQFKAIAIVGGRKGQEPRRALCPLRRVPPGDGGVLRAGVRDRDDGRERAPSEEAGGPAAPGLWPGELAVREKGAGHAHGPAGLGALPLAFFAPAALVIPEIFMPPRGTACV